MTTTDRKTLALSYLDAIAKHDLDRVERLLTPDLQFRGPSMTRSSAADFIQALKRISAIHVRSDGPHYLHGFDLPAELPG